MPLKKLKRAAGKILGGAKKVVRKVVPKEIGGILQVAAPFVAANPTFGILGGLATSLAGQLRTGQGRINPFSTLAAIAPSQQFRGFTRGLPGGTRLDEFLYGTKGRFADVQGPTLPVLGDDPTQVTALGRKFIPETQGILGIGGDFGLKEFTKGKLLSPKLDAKGNPILSKPRVAGLIAAGGSLAMANRQIEEEAEEAGITSESTLDQLKAEAAEIFKDFDTTAFRPNVAEGGLMRTNLAMGSKPTPKESGLGGLPIEADMRYTGGFMPYGAKEKADDVPARLSKNEFVFTADAVRAAGGGDINMGARRMYNTMKQLESMGRA